VSAAVVVPKREVFVEEVKQLLVLATPIEIVLLAVHVDPKTQSMELIDSTTSEMSVSFILIIQYFPDSFL